MKTDILPSAHTKRDESSPNFYHKLCSIASKKLCRAILPRFRMVKFFIGNSKLGMKYPSLRQNQRCTMDYSSSKKLIDVVAQNFKATDVFGSSKG